MGMAEGSRLAAERLGRSILAGSWDGARLHGGSPGTWEARAPPLEVGTGIAEPKAPGPGRASQAEGAKSGATSGTRRRRQRAKGTGRGSRNTP